MKSLTTRSMFGDQPHSKRRSAPSYGFGSSTRNQAAKVFLSQEHAKLSTPGFSPGPSAYQLRSSVGSQPDGRKSSAPQWIFGSSGRFGAFGKSEKFPGPGSYDMPQGVGMQVSSSKQTQPMFGFGSAGREHVAKVYLSEEHNKSLHGCDSPGPQVYTLQGAVGKQELSRTRNQPTWVFGSSQRFQYEHVKRAATSPGPGAYTQSQAIGSQIMSTKCSAPLPGFGTSDREQTNKIYISADHEKAQCGNNSPGPGNYSITPSTGRQSLSQYSSQPSWGFGTSSRWTKDAKQGSGNTTPGPGSYCI